jgi:competence protein ComEA
VCLLALVSLAASLPVLEGGDGGRAPVRAARRKPAMDKAGEAARALVNGGQMDINTASCGELEMLPGIGPALASRIVSFREEYGAFRSVDELTRIRGIGPMTLARARPMLTVGKEEK